MAILCYFSNYMSMADLYRYRDKYVNGDNFYNCKGRPAILGGVQKAKLIECLTTSNYQMWTEDYKVKFQELAEEHAEERHKTKSQVKKISRRTLARYEDELNIKTGNAEVTTNARAVATADIRNSVSFAVMNKYMVPLTQPALILNVDATQFTVGEKHGKIQIKYVESSKNSLKAFEKLSKLIKDSKNSPSPSLLSFYSWGHTWPINIFI